MTPNEDHTIVLRDGRTLAYAEYGDPAGRPVFYFHGTPGSRLEARFLAEAATRARLWLIGVDRPGFGRSDFKPKRRFLDWPDDIAELADALGLDRFAVAGLSGGGPHVAACAFRIPERLTAAAVISGAGPLEARFPLGLGRVRRAIFRAGARLGVLLGRPLIWWTALTIRHTPALLFPRFIDKRVLSRADVRAQFKEDVTEAFLHGGRGITYEYTLFPQDWGFTPHEIAIHVDLWHGDADRIVPIKIGRWVAEQIRDCNATYYPGEGHLLFVDHADDIMLAIRRSIG